ncbi:TetR/AcrR family transcriptional regulator [Nonomuraea sp. NEAU-A123]|uniref:TetR/AcrR family transcriptional regulator n=1 Tax=Nonomuraea sp. NEAU-A123 TaxID=2839649 RepID=UPI0027E08E61|nr:TetR/AcrR family transcriptional regulator [Nonomuraea sp. NEAU-A123]
MCERRMLPIVGQPQPERADAARNRQKIIEVAARMVADGSVDQLSLDGVAREACVGVGTVYRRFGDRAGLVLALIDDRERRFQAAFLNGPPPVGPGAPPAERIRAFLHALIDRVVEQLDLFLLLELGPPATRLSGPYKVHHTHLTGLLAQVRPEGAGFLADALLAPINAHLLRHQRDERGMSVEEIKAGFDALTQAIRA